MMKRVILAVAALSVGTMLTACGGGGGAGGGGAGGNAYFETPVAIGTFEPLIGATTDIAILDIFNQDLDGVDGDEVIVVGRQSDNGVAGSPVHQFNIRIYGWSINGTLEDQTNSWFANNENIIPGSEPSVHFADVNGDNQVDMVIAASTDTGTNRGQTMFFMNDGSSHFTKTVAGPSNLWSHDSIVYDLDGVNGVDIITTNYGSGSVISSLNIMMNDGTGNFTTTTFDQMGASSVSVGDYIMGNSGLELVLTDNGGGARNQDTVLYELTFVNGVPALSNKTVLPDTLLVNSHAIRNVALDFDNNGTLDVVVFERDQAVGGGSAVQFLSNDGYGTFTNVDVLSGYDGTNGGVNYQPVVGNFGGVSGHDIFLSGQDFEAPYTQTQILVETSTGVYESKYAEAFTAFWNAIDNGAFTAENAHIVTGPGGTNYVVSHVLTGMSATTYAAKITVSF